MIDQQRKEIMQTNSGALLKGLHSKGFSSNLQDGTTLVEGFEVNDEISAQQASRSALFGPPYEIYQGPLYQQDIGMFSTFLPDFQSVQLSQLNGSENQLNGFESQLNGFENQIYSMNYNYSVPIESRYQYVPFGMFYQGYPYKSQLQEFQYFVVIDFEATCDKEKNPHPQEIIEFPSVLVNSMTGQLEASFQTYVQPAYNQHLTDFCKDLTGIQQIQVDRGVPLSVALLMHDKWLEEKGVKHTNFAVVTWSNWDCRVMLESECRIKNIRKPSYFNRWINLKVPFSEVFSGVRCNLKDAVKHAGLAWEGRAHCGLDDARNTARLLSYIMHLGFRFSITNSLMCPADWPPDSALNPTKYPYQLKQPSVSIAQSVPIRVDSAKERKISISAGGVKITKPPSKCLVQSKTASSSVVATGLPREVAYVLTSNGLLATTGNSSSRQGSLTCKS